MDLEEKILNNKYYLLEYYENIDSLLEEASLILDFGMSNEKIEQWLKSNHRSITKIEELLEQRAKTLC